MKINKVCGKNDRYIHEIEERKIRASFTFALQTVDLTDALCDVLG